MGRTQQNNRTSHLALEPAAASKPCRQSLTPPQDTPFHNRFHPLTGHRLQHNRADLHVALDQCSLCAWPVSLAPWSSGCTCVRKINMGRYQQHGLIPRRQPHPCCCCNSCCCCRCVCFYLLASVRSRNSAASSACRMTPSNSSYDAGTGAAFGTSRSSSSRCTKSDGALQNRDAGYTAEPH